jgi:hypothetical protein
MRSMMRRRAAASTLLLLLASGCGSGDGDAAADGAVAVATEVESDWTRNATEFRDRVGERVAYRCSAEGSPDALWGTGPYTDDSSVCTAGVHAGVITVEEGGRVVIEISEGLDSYAGGSANGVDAQPWPAWPGSFSVVRT